MSIGLVGRKCGMSANLHRLTARSIPVTLIEATPNRITQVKTVETDGYNAVQVTAGSKRAALVNKPLAGHYAKAKVEGGRGLWEFRVEAKDLGQVRTSAAEAQGRRSRSRSARWSTSPASPRARASRARSSATTSRWATRRTATRCRIARRARSASARRRAACSRARRCPATWVPCAQSTIESRSRQDRRRASPDRDQAVRFQALRAATSIIRPAAQEVEETTIMELHVIGAQKPLSRLRRGLRSRSSARAWCIRSWSRIATPAAPAPRRRRRVRTVSGTTKKFKKQKGGGARHGDYRAPIFVGGGVTFARHARAASAQKVNKKMYRGAISVDPVGAESPGPPAGRRARSTCEQAEDQGRWSTKLSELDASASTLIVTENGRARTCSSPRATAASSQWSTSQAHGSGRRSSMPTHVLMTVESVKKIEEWLA